jgi:protein ImuA
MPSEKADIIARLQREILPLQGYKSSLLQRNAIALGPINDAFPGGVFPLGAVHEFVISDQPGAAPTAAFVMGIIAKLAESKGVALWISSSRTLFPPALSLFGINPDKIIFINLEKEYDCFWAMEEALKCDGLTAVVCETQNLSFTASRRFQLAVESSGVTGFILRNNPRSITTNACIARWKITSLNSQAENGLPGIGFPRWKVELLKVRNGKPGSWQIEFAAKQFRPIVDVPIIQEEKHKKTG